MLTRALAVLALASSAATVPSGWDVPASGDAPSCALVMTCSQPGPMRPGMHPGWAPVVPAPDGMPVVRPLVPRYGGVRA